MILIPKPTLRVFIAVLALCSAGRNSVSIRRVARRLGFASPNAVRPALLLLKALGWIDYETHLGQIRKGPGGTIRPVMRMELC